MQGLGSVAAAVGFRHAFAALLVLSDPLPGSLFLAAAEIYRSGRAKGLAVRSGTDCLIAAIAIAIQVPIWHNDRDFDLIARYTSLECRRIP